MATGPAAGLGPVSDEGRTKVGRTRAERRPVVGAARALSPPAPPVSSLSPGAAGLPDARDRPCPPSSGAGAQAGPDAPARS